jgi:hypothetical protein
MPAPFAALPELARGSDFRRFVIRDLPNSPREKAMIISSSDTWAGASVPAILPWCDDCGGALEANTHASARSLPSGRYAKP